jgi:two-component system, cell cycle sensor histidine kinase and response regulator CckA
MGGAGNPLGPHSDRIGGCVTVGQLQDIGRWRGSTGATLLAAIVDSSDDAIVGKTVDGLITSWNTGAERMYGYTADEVLGQPVTILSPADRIDETKEILAKIRRGERVLHLETIRQRKDGTTLPVSVTVSPVRDEEGKLIGVSSIARDNTEQHRNYAAFIRGEAAEKVEKGTDQEAWDSVRRDAEQIEQAGKRVTLLVHQLLTAGSQEVARVELIDLNQVVGGIEDLLRSTVGRHIEFDMSLAPRLWPVTADPGQVEQVLLNLAMNARDAMPNGGTFSIETQNLTIGHSDAGRHPGLTPGAYVCLGVRDSGAGMEPDILERAFEPFFTTKPLVEGGGLGLAGVYGIINQAGGTVDISSAPSVGTTITAWLPATLDGEHQQALTSAGR